MTDVTLSANASAAGVATVTFIATPAGLMWVVPQVSLETVPFRVGATCTVRKNGRFLSSTALGSGDTAYGPPAIILYRGDQITFTWAGMTAGDECLATLFYSEQSWAEVPDPTTAV
jgi:hypothetical protein